MPRFCWLVVFGVGVLLLPAASAEAQSALQITGQGSTNGTFTINESAGVGDLHAAGHRIQDGPGRRGPGLGRFHFADERYIRHVEGERQTGVVARQPVRSNWHGDSAVSASRCARAGHTDSARVRAGARATSPLAFKAAATGSWWNVIGHVARDASNPRTKKSKVTCHGDSATRWCQRAPMTLRAKYLVY